MAREYQEELPRTVDLIPYFFIDIYMKFPPMTSKPHTDEVYKEKRRPKGEIKFKISLNDEQKEAKRIIYDNTVTIVTGKAGSGKSALAAQVALDMLFKGHIQKIVITRPVVTAGEEIGILPGDINSKLAPFTAPVYDNMHRIYSKEKIEALVAEGVIEIIPLGFFRGRNLSDCLLIVDEAQNVTDVGFELILTRICNGTKVIVCGDSAQIDLRRKGDSGLNFLCKHGKDVPGLSIVNLKTNHRHSIVDHIVEMYAEFNQR